MKNKIAKIFSAFAMTVVISCTSLSASANSTIKADVPCVVLRSSDNGGISTQEWDPPSSNSGEVSLPYTAEPYPIYAGHDCYTSHYFKTSSGKLTLNYHLYALQPAVGYRSVEFELLKGKKGFLWNIKWSSVDSKSISFNDTIDEYITSEPYTTYDGTVTFSDLEKDTMYCILIKNTTEEDPNPTHSRENAICGTIDITE